VLVAIALFIAFIAGTGGYLLGRRNHQTTLPHPQEMRETNTCAEAEVRSIRISPDFRRGVLPDAMPGKIEIASPSTLETTPGTARKAVTVIALGPGLGSMDSRDIKTDLVCTAKGFVLTATIMRSADYHGAVKKTCYGAPELKWLSSSGTLK
jgi:hypothetical protein